MNWNKRPKKKKEKKLDQEISRTNNWALIITFIRALAV